MEDMWAKRDLPVLDATVALLEETDLPEVADIARRAGIDVAGVGRALRRMDGVYVDLQMTAGDAGAWFVRGVTSGARRAVGQWPTPESLVDRLAEAFTAAAEREPDPKRRSRAVEVAKFIGETGRDLAVQVAGAVIGYKVGGA